MSTLLPCRALGGMVLAKEKKRSPGEGGSSAVNALKISLANSENATSLFTLLSRRRGLKCFCRTGDTTQIFYRRASLVAP